MSDDGNGYEASEERGEEQLVSDYMLDRACEHQRELGLFGFDQARDAAITEFFQQLAWLFEKVREKFFPQDEES
jgi:hypothetical protein